MFNPYLQEFNQIRHSFKDYTHREILVQKYAWAVPNDEAIEAIKALNTAIVEIGAGSGYWARVLKEAGIEVKAFDHFKGEYTFTDNWFEVEQGSTEKAVEHSDKALMLCWPNYNDPFAYNTLKEFKGNTFIYIGESGGGCTGDDQFHHLLNTKWNHKESINLPQWFGIHDYLSIWIRR
jgi:hypothetical protein